MKKCGVWCPRWGERGGPSGGGGGGGALLSVPVRMAARRSCPVTAARKPASLPDMRICPLYRPKPTDDEAITQMVEDNLNQREEILPSERAKALKMQLEAIKHQGLPALRARLTRRTQANAPTRSWPSAIRWRSSRCSGISGSMSWFPT